MPPKFQLLALLAFAVAMFFLENQIQKLEESRGKLGEWKMLRLGRLQTLLEAGRGTSSPQSEILSPDTNHVSFSALEAAVCFQANRQYTKHLLDSPAAVEQRVQLRF
ncbi:Heparan sulfate 2-O-sulfotransferase 1 [Takifugu flavidus]|uniref:Heparan sulfate 2-O-sulfotransferase 1 n=1 Tax=Takifugu flavidus TaxID=433684 RepID=A0A5C6NZ18_9TELE|nr:Heparan sulfate 2-O-sulfotransferase 1 [Takifugu flavidus]